MCGEKTIFLPFSRIFPKLPPPVLKNCTKKISVLYCVARVSSVHLKSR
nr:MAG TPA: hypothetical protein [Caudoviricetes sp.]